MLIAGVDRRFVQQATFTNNDTAVAVEHDAGQMVEQILALFPDTRTVVIVIGASELEQFWVRQTQQELARFEGRLNFVWTNDLSFAQLLNRCATLPPHSAILYGVLSLDANGEPQVEAQTLAQLHGVANAPLFGLSSPQFGRGIVGGPLLSIDELSHVTTRVALRILGGESPRGISTPTQLPGAPVFDWRELRRWRIDEARLPLGSVVEFREQSVWQRYRRPIVAAAAFAGVQTLVVIALVVNMVHLRRTDRSPSADATARVAPSTAGDVHAPTDGRDVTEVTQDQTALSSLSRRLMTAHEKERASVARKLHAPMAPCRNGSRNCPTSSPYSPPRSSRSPIRCTAGSRRSDWPPSRQVTATRCRQSRGCSSTSVRKTFRRACRTRWRWRCFACCRRRWKTR
jgi:hypothetical protein